MTTAIEHLPRPVTGFLEALMAQRQIGCRHLVTTGRLCHPHPAPGSRRGGHDTQVLNPVTMSPRRTLPCFPYLKPWTPSVASRAPKPLSTHTGLLVGQAASLGPHRPCSTSPWVALEACASPFPGPLWGPSLRPSFPLSKDGKACQISHNLEWRRMGVFGVFIFTWLYQILVVAHRALTCRAWDLSS